MPLKYTINSTHYVSALAQASMVSTDHSLLTLIFWAMWPDISDPAATRSIMNQTGGTNGLSLFRRATPGTQLRAQWSRVTTAQTVDLTGLVANQPQLCCITIDHTNGPKSYRGDLRNPAVETTAVANIGSGTHNDTGSTWYLGSAAGVANDGMIMYLAAIYNRVFALRDVLNWQIDPFRFQYSAAAFWRPGTNGTGLMMDESGNRNHGIITGAIPNNNFLPRVA